MTPQDQAQLQAQALGQEATARTSKEIGDLALRAIEAEARLAMKEAEVEYLRQAAGGPQAQLNGLVAAFAMRALGGNPGASAL